MAEFPFDQMRQIAATLRTSDPDLSEHEIAVLAWARATGEDEHMAWATWCSGLNAAARLVPRQRIATNTSDRIDDATFWNCGAAPAPVAVRGSIGVP
jgi:hypothetical protein